MSERAAYGLRYEATRQGLHLHTYNVEAMADNAIRHAVTAGELVPYADHRKALEDEQTRTRRARSSWAAATVERDQLLSRVQRALSRFAVDDPNGADLLAAEIGVLLLLEPHS